jgi:hypothetical protein
VSDEYEATHHHPCSTPPYQSHELDSHQLAVYHYSSDVHVSYVAAAEDVNDANANAGVVDDDEMRSAANAVDVDGEVQHH